MPHYKVVQIINGRRASVCQNIFFPEKAMAFYSTEWITTPPIPNSKLFVFDDLALVREFLRRNSLFENIEVWECEVENPERVYTLSVVDFVLEYWKSSNTPTMDAPRGTIGVDSVKLLKQVTLEEEEE